MIDRGLAADALTAALAAGGDFAELFLEHREANSLTLTNGEAEEAVSGITHGVGVRVFVGLNAVYAYGTDFGREGLMRLAKQAAGGVRGAKGGGVVAPFAPLAYDAVHTVKTALDTVGRKRVADMLRPADSAARGYSGSVTGTELWYADSVQDVLVVNSEGLWAQDRRARTRAGVTVIAGDGAEKQTAFYGPGRLSGFEFYDDVDFKALGERTAAVAVTMLNAELCPGGRMPVVIDGGFGGVIFHEACGHSLEATSVAKGLSVFSGKLGQRIASGCVTAIDDGTMPNEWGSLHMDDEGHLTQRNVLIENGILKSYLIDKLNGRRMGLPSTGSGRRESYRFAPTSRMTNTYIAPGTDERDEIIGGTEYGLYAKKMGGGSVSPTTGEYNFAVNEGYMIRNGKIAEAVRGATLIGRGDETLLLIDRVAREMTMEQGMCGSISGSVPTNVGQPMIRVKELTVGGRK